MVSQKSLIDQGNWDILIILDACRFDFFQEEYRQYLSGNLRKVESEGRDTLSWACYTFPDYYDITYVSGAVPINSVKTDLSYLPFKVHYLPVKHFREIVDVWKFGWNFNLGTVMPRSVTEAALRRNGRRIVHYFQPHAPYIGKKMLLGKIGYHVGCGQGNPPDDVIWVAVKQGRISREQLREFYRLNLQLVLGHATNLISRLNGKTGIIVTADHGEALGEDGVFMHGFDHPTVREVPWLEVEWKKL